MVPSELRSCLHPAAVPADVPRILGPGTLREAYEAERGARIRDQAAAVDCGHKLAVLDELIDAFNVVHASHEGD